jgi:glycerol kinase
MILAIDQGTSSTKACLFEPPGSLIASATVPVGHTSDEHGAVNQDPHELVESCRTAARSAIRKAGVRARDVSAAALANQGESFLLLDQVGRPRTPVVGWQDVTGADAVDRVAGGPHAGDIRARTGLPLHAMFPGAKLAHHHRLLGEADSRFATLDTWLMQELDPRRPFVTDRATASRTMLVSLDGDDWDDDLLGWLDVSREWLATIVPCDSPGVELELDGVSIPLWASGYDMGLALLGHGCLKSGETKATFGTCLGVMAAAGSEPSFVDGLLSVVAYGLGDTTAYALDGEIAACGALVQWAIGCGIASSLHELEELARSTPSAGGAVLVPAIQGLGAPHWRADVQASLVGMSESTGRAQLARAVLDAIAWSLADVLDVLRRAGNEVEELRVDGGLAKSDFLLQLCADAAQVPVVRVRQQDATAYGAAALAMLSHGLVTTTLLRDSAAGHRRFDPRQGSGRSERDQWTRAMARALER